MQKTATNYIFPKAPLTALSYQCPAVEVPNESIRTARTLGQIFRFWLLSFLHNRERESAKAFVAMSLWENRD